MADQKEQNGIHVLTDDELLSVAAGAATAGDRTYERVMVNWYTQCGSVDNGTGELFYCPCPRCGKPMHSEIYAVKWFCDPCNYSEWRPNSVSWSALRPSSLPPRSRFESTGKRVQSQVARHPQGRGRRHQCSAGRRRKSSHTPAQLVQTQQRHRDML